MRNFINKVVYGKSNKKDYTKEDIQSKSKPQLFFDILSVKVWELIKLNFLLLVFLLPLIIWSVLNFSTIAVTDAEYVGVYKLIYFVGLLPCLCLLAAPLAGITYIIRNFTQDKHTWLWADFISHSKSNAKQAILYMLIYSIMLILGQAILYSYSLMMTGSSILPIMKTIFLVIYLLVCTSIIYVFPMLVTYKLTLKDIIKNSLLLTIGRLPKTVLFAFLAILPGALLLLVSFIWPYAQLILVGYYTFIGITFGMYTLISYTTATFEDCMENDNDESKQPTEDK